jgi:hypothetical protein
MPASLTPLSAETPRRPGWRESRLLNLEPLVTMKLASFRLKDQVHLQDLAGVGLIDETWLNRVSPALSERLYTILLNRET